MLKIYDKFSPRANPPDSNYLYGSIKNESVPGAKDGTPLDAQWGNDYAGFDSALLAAAGLTADGNPDTAVASQRLQALNIIVGKYSAIATMLSADTPAGKLVSTGSTTWKILPSSASRGLALNNGNKAVPLNGLWGSDAGVTYDGENGTDDTVALNQLYQYAKDLEEAASGTAVATSTKPTVCHSSGKCLVTGTINTGGNLISKGQRTMFFATSGTFPLFSTSCYNTAWHDMQFDHPTGQHIVCSNTTRIESSKLDMYNCEHYRCAPNKHCIETDTSTHYNYPMIATITNAKSYGSSFARLHTNAVNINDSWLAWNTDVTTVPLIECSNPLSMNNVTEVPYGSNPNRLPRIYSPAGRSLSLACRSVRFGGEATTTPIVRTNTDIDNDCDISFTECSMFGVADFYWAEFDGFPPRRISIKRCQGLDSGGFVNTLGMRVGTAVDPLDYNYSTFLDVDQDVPAIACKMIVTDVRTGTAVPSGAVSADYIFDKNVKIDESLSLINYDIGNGFSLFAAPYQQSGGAALGANVPFLGYTFNRWDFQDPSENIRITSPGVTPAGGAGIYSCAVYVIPQNGSATFNAGYEKSTGGAGAIDTNNGLCEVGYNRIAWKFYFNGIDPVDVYFNVSSVASAANTQILIGGVTINKGDTVGRFVPVHTGAIDGMQEVSFGTAPPADGRWKAGSYRHNIDPVTLTPDGNGFYLAGWMCTNGSPDPGVWQQDWRRNIKGTP